jgi:hypothetical protein
MPTRCRSPAHASRYRSAERPRRATYNTDFGFDFGLAVTAPDPFVAPYYSFLLERTPKGPPDEPRAWRNDEYPD